jgi:hypothetical protein
MLEQHNSLQHTKQTYSTAHCMCIFIHEQNLTWRNHTRTHNADYDALRPIPKFYLCRQLPQSMSDPDHATAQSSSGRGMY